MTMKKIKDKKTVREKDPLSEFSKVLLIHLISNWLILDILVQKSLATNILSLKMVML